MPQARPWPSYGTSAKALHLLNLRMFTWKTLMKQTLSGAPNSLGTLPPGSCLLQVLPRASCSHKGTFGRRAGQLPGAVCDSRPTGAGTQAPAVPPLSQHSSASAAIGLQGGGGQVPLEAASPGGVMAELLSQTDSLSLNPVLRRCFCRIPAFTKEQTSFHRPGGLSVWMLLDSALSTQQTAGLLQTGPASHLNSRLPSPSSTVSACLLAAQP